MCRQLLFNIFFHVCTSDKLNPSNPRNINKDKLAKCSYSTYEKGQDWACLSLPTEDEEGGPE